MTARVRGHTFFHDTKNVRMLKGTVMNREIDRVEVITSRKNPFLLKMASLQEKKYREEQKLFLVEGKKLVEEVFLSGLLPEYLLFAESKYEVFMPKLHTLCRSLGVEMPRVF